MKFWLFQKVEKKSEYSWKKLNICDIIVKFKVKHFEHLCSNTRVNKIFIIFGIEKSQVLS